MGISWLSVFYIIGAICIFIYGMKRMSDSVQRAAGEHFRQVLQGITRHKWTSFFTGFFITAIIQSSSAFTVTIVSFVNAGLITAMDSAALIMGSNVGTTITGWLVTLFGFRISMSDYAVPLFALGVPLLFISSGKWKYWGECTIGLALIFLGLGFLREAIPLSSEDTAFFTWVKMLSNDGWVSRLLFVGIGIFITLIVQSSSVAMAITLTLCLQGWIPLEMAASLILGENIGTTSTALMASLMANREARATAFIHFWFNVSGVTWMIFILPWFLEGLAVFLSWSIGVSDMMHNPLDMTIGLAAFHSSFNILQSLILIHFIPWLSRVGYWTAGVDTDTWKGTSTRGITFLESEAVLPEIALLQIQKETMRFGQLVSGMAGDFSKVLITPDTEKQLRYIRKIEEKEEETDRLEFEITDYITSLSKGPLTSETSVMLRSIVAICNDLERVADLYYQLTVTIRRKKEDQIYFLPQQRNNLHEMNQLITQALEIMNENLAANDYRQVSKYNASRVEKRINQLRNRLRTENASSMTEVDYNTRSAAVYNTIFMSMERIGDHIMNVTESITGEI